MFWCADSVVAYPSNVYMHACICVCVCVCFHVYNRSVKYACIYICMYAESLLPKVHKPSTTFINA